MGPEIADARRARVLRVARCDTRSHRWLHHQPWGNDRPDPYGEGRPYRWRLEPSSTDDRQKHEGEDHADRVMGDPSDGALADDRFGVGDPRVEEAAVPKVRYPTAKQPVVKRLDA